MKLRRKIFYTFSLIIMSPMLRDDPKSIEKDAKRSFWTMMKKLWNNELDKELE